MTPRRVRFTATAQEHVRREETWWRENRTYAEILAAELEDAVHVLAILPGAGTPYIYADVPDVRRLYLRKIACHLYYTFDEHEVIIRALWGARCERAPIIEP